MPLSDSLNPPVVIFMRILFPVVLNAYKVVAIYTVLLGLFSYSLLRWTLHFVKNKNTKINK